MIASLIEDLFGCKVRRWRGHDCIVFTKQSCPTWDTFAGEDTSAFYAYGYFFFRDKKAFKSKVHRRHEWTHKKQAEREGSLLFALSYVVCNIVHGYDDNPYEVEARKAEKRRKRRR